MKKLVKWPQSLRVGDKLSSVGIKWKLTEDAFNSKPVRSLASVGVLL